VDAVIKLGGSLLGDEGLASLLGTLGGLAKTQRLVVVPGGGPFADAVRRASALHDPGADAAHWMAILGMDQHAHFLAGLLPAARLVVDSGEIAPAAGEGRLAVLAPFAWLRATDALPHGWDVTSDSIAAWVAGQLGARRLVLLKAVQGVTGGDGEVLPEADSPSAALAGIVDEYFPRALPPGVECWILSGRHPERLGELFRDGRARGTRVR
jgi:aspartokinase-like uncharacterized kinase